MSDSHPLVPAANYEIIQEAGADKLISQIRPYWQATSLIERVRRLLWVDPSSACQRLFNASIHDLQQKLAIAGVDIVAEAAKQNKLPPIVKPEDIEQYTPYNTIALAAAVGLLTRAESKRMFRVYDIRGDLEHEDDEYEATVEDCLYVFKTCIECVLSRDPIEVIRLVEIKSIVEQPVPITLSDSVIEDFSHAPAVRQLEIARFLVSNALNPQIPDLVRQNCYQALRTLGPHTQTSVAIDLSTDFSKRIGKAPPTLAEARVAFAAGVLPYLKKAQLRDLFKGFLEQMRKVGYTFRSHGGHGELLRNFADVGGLTYCPEEVTQDILEWLVLLYIGEPGGYGMGAYRRVFYSNVGAPLALKIIEDAKGSSKDHFDTLKTSSKLIKAAIGDQHVARRFESVSDLFQTP